MSVTGIREYCAYRVLGALSYIEAGIFLSRERHRRYSALSRTLDASESGMPLLQPHSCQRIQATLQDSPPTIWRCATKRCKFCNIVSRLQLELRQTHTPGPHSSTNAIAN